jgi:GntR family transcriptional regulator/MocR family aminotransferase
VYGARRNALLTGLQKDFGPWLTPVPSAAGLHLAALATRGVDVESLVERAEQSGVGVRSLRRFEVGRAGRAGIVFGYGTLDERGIAEGLARLRRLLGPVKIRARGS